MANISRRKLVTRWTTPVVLSLVLPRHAQASIGGLRWRFLITITEGTSTIFLGDSVEVTPLESPRSQTVTFLLTPAEIAAGAFVRERGSLAGDYERFVVSIDNLGPTALSGTVEYNSADAPFSFIGTGTFTATCA